MQPVLQFEGLEFNYPGNGFGLQIPRLTLQAGETLFLAGDSGSGKSTFLNLAAGVLMPRAGHVSLAGRNLSLLSTSKRDALRVDHVGFLFQQFNLINYLGVLDNVTLPCRFSMRRKRNAEQLSGSITEAALQLLDKLGMGSFLKQPVDTLSVGQQQRVAVARALIGKPDLVIADEPTSALDANHQEKFLDLLLSQAASQNTAVLLVSHDPHLASLCTRKISISEFHAGATA